MIGVREGTAVGDGGIVGGGELGAGEEAVGSIVAGKDVGVAEGERTTSPTALVGGSVPGGGGEKAPKAGLQLAQASTARVNKTTAGNVREMLMAL
jgi:hypothetical protein